MESAEARSDPRFAWFERAAFWVAMASCILLLLFTLAEIAARPLAVQVYVGGEYNGMLMGWLIFFALPVVTRARQHLIVDVFHGMMGARGKAIINWLGALLMVIYVAALLYFCSKLTIASWNNNIRTQGILRTPIVYPQVGMVIGLALMWISALLVLVSETRALARPKPEASRS